MITSSVKLRRFRGLATLAFVAAWSCFSAWSFGELPERIVWYGVLEDGLEEALMTGKPILLTSAAPQCLSVPGIWWPGKQNTDRSFLTNDAVIKAAKDFVCIRLATYEDKEEGEFLASLGAGRTEALANTVFCFVSPNGQELLTGAKRGPQQLFRNPAGMVSYMKGVAESYATETSTKKKATPLLPKLKNVRLALNVAECDKQPMVVAYGDGAALKAVDVPLGQVAYHESIRGRYVYATTKDANDLKQIGIAPDEPGIYVVDPDAYGLKGTELARLPMNATMDTIIAKLETVAKELKVDDKSHREHVKAGGRDGVKWETEIPVTDPGSLKAMERRQSSGEQRRRGSSR